MKRPKLYKENNVWYCSNDKIIGKGATPIEAFTCFLIQRASKNLHQDEINS